MKMALWDFALRKRGVYGLLHILILLLSLFLVISISIDTFKNIPFYTQTSYMKIQLWICLFFLFDFFFELVLSKDKWRYIRTHFIFFLVAIPYQNIISYYHIEFSPEINYFIRFIPLVRGGYALAIVVGWLSYNKASGLFISYITMLFATVYFASLIFYVLETKVNPLVTNYGDALWWAFMDVTTVGSNIIAVTVTGRVLSVLLAALGMMMFPIFTVYVTSLVQRTNKEKKAYYAELNKEMETSKSNASMAPKPSDISVHSHKTKASGSTSLPGGSGVTGGGSVSMGSAGNAAADGSGIAGDPGTSGE